MTSSCLGCRIDGWVDGNVRVNKRRLARMDLIRAVARISSLDSALDENIARGPAEMDYRTSAGAVMTLRDLAGVG